LKDGTWQTKKSGFKKRNKIKQKSNDDSGLLFYFLFTLWPNLTNCFSHRGR